MALIGTNRITGGTDRNQQDHWRRCDTTQTCDILVTEDFTHVYLFFQFIFEFFETPTVTNIRHIYNVCLQMLDTMNECGVTRQWDADSVGSRQTVQYLHHADGVIRVFLLPQCHFVWHPQFGGWMPPEHLRRVRNDVIPLVTVAVASV